MSRPANAPQPRLTFSKFKKYCRRFSLYAFVLGGFFVAARYTSGAATTLIWDAAPSTPGDGAQDGTGTWNGTNVNWWNGGSDQTWTNSSTDAPVFAQFGAGTVAPKRDITVSGTLQTAGLILAAIPNALSSTNPSYTFTGGTIAIDENGTISFADAASSSSSFVSITSALAGHDVTIQKSAGTAEQFLALGGANTWDGTLTVSGANGGMFVRTANSNALNSLAAVVVQSGATLNLQGAGSTYTSPFTVSGTGSGGTAARGAIRFENAMTLSGLITLAGDTTLNFQSSSAAPSDVKFTGGMTESGGSFSFTKTGTGTLTLLNTANYTGTTSVAKAVTGADPGTLLLDFENAASPIVDNMLYHGVAPGALVLTGNTGRTQDVSTATLEILGANETANTQAFNGVTVTGPTALLVTSGDDGSVDLNVGAITRLGTGTTLAITGPASGSITTTTNKGTLLGPWATYTIGTQPGVSWAGSNADGVLGSFIGEQAYINSTSLSSAPYSSTSNLFLSNTSTSAVTQGDGVTSINTITMRGTNVNRTVTVGAGNTLDLGALGGVQLLLGSRSITIGAAGNAGTLTAGTLAGAELYLSNFDTLNLLTVNSVIANNAGGAVNVIINGVGTTVLTGTNTYTGSTSIDSGILEIQSDGALGTVDGATLVGADGTLQLTGGRKIAENITINGTGVNGAGALFSKTGDNTWNGLITLGSDGAEITAAQGSTLHLFRTSGTTAVISGSHNVIFGGDGDIIVGSMIGIGTGTTGGTLTKTGAGTLFLTVANTYSGVTTINQGAIQISNATALGVSSGSGGTTVNAGGALELAGGITVGSETLTLNGTGVNMGGALRNVSGNNVYSSAITLKTASRINSDAGTLTLSGAITGTFALTLGGEGNILFTSPSILGATLTKDGDGTLSGALSDAVGYVIQNGNVTATLAGSVATVTLTKNTSNTATLSGANTYAGATTVSDGRLVLDYSGGATVLPVGDAINLSGGALEVAGSSSGATAATLGILTTTNASGLSTLAVDANTALTMASYTRVSGSSLLIDLSAAGSSLNFTSAPLVRNGQIVGDTGSNAAVVVKTSGGSYDFAALGANNSVVALHATTELPSASANANLPYALTADGTTHSLTASETVSSLRIDSNAGGGTLDLNGNTLGLTLLGLLHDGSEDFTITNSGTTGSISGPNAVFIYQYGTGKLTLDATMTGSTPQTFLMGTTLIDWTAASGNNGPVFVLGATVRLSGTGLTLDGGTTGNGIGLLSIGNNGILELNSGDFTRAVNTSGAAVRFYSGGGGFSAYGADRIVNLGGASATLTWGSGGFLAQGSKLILGSPYSNATVDFQNGLNLNGGYQIVDVQSANVAGVGGQISGGITGTGGGLTKIGQGILTLSGFNNYTGFTAVSAGTLVVTGSINGSTAVRVASAAELRLSAAGAVSAGTLSLADGSKLSLEVGTLTSSTISLTDNVTLTGTITLALTLTADPTDGTLFTLIDGNSAVAGYGSGARFFADGHALAEGSTFNVTTGGFSQQFQISYLGGTDGDDVTIRAVPEPNTSAVLLASVGMLMGLNRFRRRFHRTVVPFIAPEGRNGLQVFNSLDT
ncbi:MAG: autotransporter-associated beta strand repeat-containing protein [Chthoniobacter sp.]